MANSSSLLLSAHICLFSRMRARLSSLISIKWSHGVTDRTCLELQCTDDRNTAKAKKKKKKSTPHKQHHHNSRRPLTVLPASASHMISPLTWMLIHNPPAPPPPASLPFHRGVRVVVLPGRPSPPQKQVWDLINLFIWSRETQLPFTRKAQRETTRRKYRGCHFLYLSTVIFSVFLDSPFVAANAEAKSWSESPYV